MKIDYSQLKHLLLNADRPAVSDPSYQLTCVFLLLFDREGSSNILAIQKSDTEGYPWRNQVALPGGHIDKTDANAVDAAFRELEEELNIPANQVELIGSMGHFQTISRKDIEVFTGIWNGKGPIQSNAAEIARVLELPVEYLVQMHQLKQFHNRVPDFHELMYPFQDVVIWGTTARILHFFIELMYPLFDHASFHKHGV